MTVFDFFVLLLVLALLLPVSILLTQVLSAIVCKTASYRPRQGNKSRVAILMPAHNEALVIAESIKSITSQLKDSDTLLVIADNCTDKTAVIAQKLGAEVVERSHQTLRGKGYALDYGLKHLAKNPPEIVLIVDADCVVHDEVVGTLANACVEHQKPVQALYLMGMQPNPSLKQKIAHFAWLVKNKVRPLGMLNIGLPCQLMGTGMAFLWDDLTRVDLASGHIVEDMQLGVDLTRYEKAPMFLPSALVTSIFPPTAEAEDTQRTRWEHGHLSVIANEVPRLLLESVRRRNYQMFGLACDLLVPPLAVLALLCVAVALIGVMLASQIGLLIAILPLALLFLAVIIAWYRFGRDTISFKQLFYAPIYALVKIPLYIKFFLNRQVEWVRSKRD